MPATDGDWVRSYARQALSDLLARECLTRTNLPKCHRLHFLQMAAEKVCKAHLTAANGHANVRRTHACVARVLPAIARHFYPLTNDANRMPVWEIAQIRRLAQEIEVLAPACDAGEARQDNSEYPWLDGHGDVQTPCEYAFPGLVDDDRRMTRLIRLIRTAAESYAE